MKVYFPAACNNVQGKSSVEVLVYPWDGSKVRRCQRRPLPPRSNHQDKASSPKAVEVAA